MVSRLFLFLFIACSVLGILVMLTFPALGLSTWVHPFSWGTLLYLMMLTLISHVIHKRIAENKPESLHLVYLGSTSGRLLLSSLAIVFVIIINRGNGMVAFLVNFVVFYILFTAAELTDLLITIKEINKKVDA